MKAITRCEVWGGGALLQLLTIEPGGSVTADRANIIRRICSISLADPTGTLVPTSAASLLAPFGNELHLYYGRSDDDVTPPVLKPRGVFQIETSEVDDTGDDLTVAITANDRAASYQRAGFTDTYTIAGATNVGSAILSLLASRGIPFVPSFNFAQTAQVTSAAPIVLGPGDDPWQQATDLATQIGFELYHDVNGVCTFIPVPDPSVAAISARYDEGLGNFALGLKRKLARTKVANYIIRDGAGSGISPPFRGVAFDNNPASSTYIGGQYGVVVDYSSSGQYGSQAAAQADAQAALLISLGSVESSEHDGHPERP